MAKLSNADQGAWHALMQAQADMAIEVEAAALAGVASWLRADHVLEVGAAAGAWLRHLVQRFPAKTYVGIDVDREAIDVAKTELAGLAQVQLRPVDFYQTGGSYDAVVCRMFVQHQTDLERFARHAAALCKTSACVVVINPGDDVRDTAPAIPGLEQFFSALRAKQRTAGFANNAIADVAASLEKQGLVVEVCRPLALPVTTPAQKVLFQRIMSLSSSLANVLYDLQLDLAQLEAGLSQWSAAENSRSHLGEVLLIARK